MPAPQQLTVQDRVGTQYVNEAVVKVEDLPELVEKYNAE